MGEELSVITEDCINDFDIGESLTETKINIKKEEDNKETK